MKILSAIGTNKRRTPFPCYYYCNFYYFYYLACCRCYLLLLSLLLLGTWRGRCWDQDHSHVFARALAPPLGAVASWQKSTPFSSFWTTRAATTTQLAATPSPNNNNNINNNSNNINGENNNQDKEQQGRTGWTHSRPDESSKFWNKSVESKTENNPSSLRRHRRRTNNLKTGWLHNTKPRASSSSSSSQGVVETTAKQQQQQQQQAGLTDNNTNDNSSSSSSSSSSLSNTTPARRLLELAMQQQERNHRIVHAATFHACGADNGVVAVTEHLLSVPLYHNKTPSQQQQQKQQQQQDRRIDVFFKIVEKVTSDEHYAWLQSLQDLTPTQRATVYVDKAALRTARDMILYLQGGPGFGAPTPMLSLGLLLTKDSSWAAAALDKYQRIVLMDQRGTGQSTTLTKQSLERLIPDLFLLDQETRTNTDHCSTTTTTMMDSSVSSVSPLQRYRETNPGAYAKVQQAVQDTVEYMAQFRADSIVHDAECIREALLMPLPTKEEQEAAVRPWGACLGQSFGGFCIMTYLSVVANPPSICLLTGGIGPASFDAYDVYTSLWRRVQERSLLYYDMYPDDVALVRKIVRRLMQKPQPLPSGGILTARRFLQLGIALGGSPSSFASLHSLFQSALLQGTENDHLPEFNRAFLKSIELEQSYDDHPIYFWLHESIYADGPAFSPPQWAAHCAYNALVAQDASFDYRQTSAPDSNQPVLLFGEMTFPWMAQDYGELKGVGLSEVSQCLANKQDWPNLYNFDRMKDVLGNNGKTRAAAAVYVDDMYVDFDCCRKLTSRGGPLENCKVWITNDYQHSGLRDDGAAIFKKIHGMATGSIRTPS